MSNLARHIVSIAIGFAFSVLVLTRNPEWYLNSSDPVLFQVIFISAAYFLSYWAVKYVHDQIKTLRK